MFIEKPKIMTEYELAGWKEQWKEDAYYYRGKVIDAFNTLEKSIEIYLSIYFNLPKGKTNDFQNIILDRLTFQSKKESFAAILNYKSKLAGFNKTKNNSYPHSSIIKGITDNQDERNRFAHYYLIIPESVSENVITLAEFRDSDNRKLHEYTMDDYVIVINKINKSIRKVSKLYMELPERFAI